MKILYNGQKGSLGRYFHPALKERNIEGKALRSRLEDRVGLVDELSFLKGFLGNEEPIVLVQMAAKVSVPACEEDPEAAQKTNVDDTAATVADFVSFFGPRSPRPKVVYVSTGHVYAAKQPGEKIDEEASLAPRSVYARTKLAAEKKLGELAQEMGFALKIVRVFGLVAPIQPSNYVLPGMIRRVKQQQLEAIPGLDYVRDYLDSRDVCDCLILLARALEEHESDKTTVYNLCSGRPLKLRTMVEEVIRSLSPPPQARALIDNLGAAPGRPDDVPYIVGDPARFVAAIGTQPLRISIEQTIHDALLLY